jgi:acetoacetate decarboxylase
MGFVRSLQEIMANTRPTAEFFDAEILSVFWETRPEIVARLLPPPLEPAQRPVAMAFVAHYPKTNFDVTYRESALFLRAVHNGEEGYYCLAMPVTNDMAMAGGREIFGFPKKMAEIGITHDNESMTGWTERRGVRFMEVRARMGGRFNDKEAQEEFITAASPDRDRSARGISFVYKHFPAPEGGAFDYNPRLVRQETLMRPKKILFGEAEIVFKHSEYDPWAEVEVARMLGAIYTVGDNTMLAGKVVGEIDPIRFAPYAFLKWDMG